MFAMSNIQFRNGKRKIKFISLNNCRFLGVFFNQCKTQFKDLFEMQRNLNNNRHAKKKKDLNVAKREEYPAASPPSPSMSALQEVSLLC